MQAKGRAYYAAHKEELKAKREAKKAAQLSEKQTGKEAETP